MTIVEKIQAGLQQKFSGVDTAILGRLAAKKAEGVTDETKVDSIVEGISFADVLTYYGDYRAGAAQITAVANYEKQHHLKDGKPVTEPTPPPVPPTPPTPPGNDKDKDMAKQIAEAVASAMKPFSDRLDKFETERTRETRSAEILAKAKEYGVPESMAKRYAIADDADLDAYFKEVKQDMADAGFSGVTPPDGGSGAKTDEELVAGMIEAGTKELIKQNK